MDLYETLKNIPVAARDCVVAIGNFDGVHKGHQALLGRAKDYARAQGKRLGVLTFEPHPRALFRPDDPPFRITPPALKQERLAACGVDFTISPPFDWDFASQSAEDFTKNIVVAALAPFHIFIGRDFRFGQLRKGCLDTLSAAGLSVTGIEAAGEGDQKYSSTDIRQYLRTGDIAAANAILGWEWEIRGPIMRGDRRGHALGYPTANVLMEGVLHPAYGVYATWVQVEGETFWRRGATNIGIRPMFELRQGQVEAHILDFEDVDIYGKILRVRPFKRLRGEAKFPNLDALITQMSEDCNEARTILCQPV